MLYIESVLLCLVYSIQHVLHIASEGLAAAVERLVPLCVSAIEHPKACSPPEVDKIWLWVY